MSTIKNTYTKIYYKHPVLGRVIRFKGIINSNNYPCEESDYFIIDNEAKKYGGSKTQPTFIFGILNKVIMESKRYFCKDITKHLKA